MSQPNQSEQKQVDEDFKVDEAAFSAIMEVHENSVSRMSNQ